MERKKIGILITEILIRVFLIILSCMMIFWYLDSHFVSLGSIAGIIFFSIIGICSLFWNLIRFVCRKLLKSKVGKIIVYGMMILSCMIVLYIISALGLMICGAKRPTADNSTVIVLGCEVRGTVPSRALKCRLDTAFQYLNDNPSAKAVLSGGKGSGENISEAQCMFNYLTENGISAERLFMEDKSTSTDENIRFSKKIIDENGLDQNIAIITDWYHEFRASVICDRNGISSGSIPSSIPAYITASLVTREMIAIPYELLFRQ